MINLFDQFAAACNPNANFFGLPTWYKYLEPTTDALGNCTFEISGLNDYWLIGFAIMDMLIRLSALVAVGFVIYSGIRYITSQGMPENHKAALKTIINALIGLVIAVIASILVSYIAKRIAG